MKLTRGQFIGLSAATLGGLSLTGCSEVASRLTAPELPERIGTADEGSDPVHRVLNRVAYGPRPGDYERVREMGVDAYVEQQLHPDGIEENWASWMRLLPMDTLDLDASDAQDLEMATYPEVGKGPAATELQQACVLRATYSARQLQEVMVEFWSDHFNISQLKAECSWLKTVDDRLIRKHSMGKFRDLVTASAHSPAMLFYLDNDKNQKKDPKTGSGPNENYARELLELHTLGIRGGYSLKDIQEVARCFTGWDYKKQKQFAFWPGDFVFDKGHHDDGSKTVLGKTIAAGGGIKDGAEVIDIVCRHPSTARFVARKLCRRFVADRGPAPLVERLAKVFQQTDGDIKSVLAELFHSQEFRAGTGQKLKRPFDFAVSALRAVNADTTGAGILPYLEKMGQLPYKWAMPDGYPDRVEAWTPSLLARWNFALDLVQNRIPHTTIDPSALVKATGAAEPGAVLQSLSRVVLGKPLPANQHKEMLALGPGGKTEDRGTRQCLALLLSTPQFQWR